MKEKDCSILTSSKRVAGRGGRPSHDDPWLSREELVAKIRETIQAEGGKRISSLHFLAASGLRKRDLFRNFAGWEEALRAAGCEEQAKNARVETATLLENWGRVAEKVRRIPSEKDYLVHGGHGHRTLCSRFGAWNGIPEAFRDFAGKKRRWRRVLGYMDHWQSDQNRMQDARGRTRKMLPRKPARLPNRPMCGGPLANGALRFAPTNEMGVVLLFGKMAEQLGFFVVGLQPAFPDCLAMREITPGNWQPVTIEFEFESRSFRIHRHRPDGCDIIVCWEHNWKECPKNLEVIALKDEIGQFQI